MKVQTLLFRVDKWTVAGVVRWLKSHGYKHDLDVTDNYIRARQVDPRRFVKGTFRTIHFWHSGNGKSISAVVGRPLKTKKRSPAKATRKKGKKL